MKTATRKMRNVKVVLGPGMVPESLNNLFTQGVICIRTGVIEMQFLGMLP